MRHHPSDPVVELIGTPANGTVSADIAAIVTILGGAAIQMRTEQSEGGPIEENAYQQFSIAIMDVDTGAVASASINIAAISATLEKSTGGAAFSDVGITQPTFAKADGRVYCGYQFAAAEWEVGDAYKLTVSGITATVGGDTAYVPMMVWSNMITEALSLDGKATDIDTDLGEPDDVVTSTLHGKIGTDTEMADRSMFDVLVGGGAAVIPAAADAANADVPLAAILRAVLTSLVGGDDYDNYTAINNTANASINAALQNLATILAANGANTFNPTIQGVARTDLEVALNAIATYIVAGGGAFSKKVNNLDLRTNLEQIVQDICSVVGCDDTNSFGPSMAGGNRLTIHDAFAALGLALGAELDGTPDLYDVLVTGLDSSGVTNNFDGSILEVTKAGLEKTTGGAYDPDTDSNEALSESITTLDGKVDHLMTTACADAADPVDMTPEVADNTVLANVMTIGGDTSDFDRRTMSLEALSTALIVGNINILCPDVDQPASAIEFTLMDAQGGLIQDAQITDVGQIDIYRYRKGTDAGWIQIVAAGAPAGTALGTLNYSYTFPTASWDPGDMVQVHVSSVQVTKGGKTYDVPRTTAYTVVGLNQIIQDWVDGGRLDLILDAIQTDIGDPSSRTNLQSIQAMIGVPDAASNSLYDAHAGHIAEVNRKAGNLQVKAATIDLHQGAAAYDLATGTDQDVILEKLVFRVPNIDVSDDATITAIKVHTDDTTVQTYISDVQGAKANLTAEAQIAWTGASLIKAGTKIQCTIVGGTADADPTTCDVIMQYRAVADGGYLA